MYTKRQEINDLKDILKKRDTEYIRLYERHAELRKENRDLKKQLDEKDERIAAANDVIDSQRESIKRMCQQLTEQELFEKKMKEAAPTGVPAVDSVVERMCRLEAKYEAQENPYFF